jgi:hypothetical protein
MSTIEKFNKVYTDFISDLIIAFPNETKQLQEYNFSSDTNVNKYIDDFVENNYPHLEALSKSDVKYFRSSDYKIVKDTSYKNILVSINATSKNVTLIWKYLHSLYILAHGIKPIDNHELYVKNIADYASNLVKTNSVNNTEDKKDSKKDIKDTDKSKEKTKTKKNGEYKDIEEFLENSSLGKFAEELVDDFKNYVSEEDIEFIKEKANIGDILKKVGNPLKALEKLKENPIDFLKTTIFKNKKEQEKISNLFSNISTKISEKVQKQTQSDNFITEITYLLKRYDLWDEEDDVNNKESNKESSDNDSKDNDRVKEIIEKMFLKLKSNSFNQEKLFSDISSIIKNFVGEDINLSELTKNIKSGNMNYEKIFSQANKLLQKFGLADGDGVANLAKLAKDMKGAPGMSQVLNMLSGGGRGGGGYRNLSANQRRERMRQKLKEVRQRKTRTNKLSKTSVNEGELLSSNGNDNSGKKKNKKRYIKKRRARKKK